MKCNYCGKEAEWVENKEVYGRNYGKSYMIWLCRDCDAYVGCHNNTKRTKGLLANKELREVRKKAHALLDPHWRGEFKTMTRAEAYKRLTKHTGVKHIGQTTIDEAKSVVGFLTNNRLT